MRPFTFTSQAYGRKMAAAVLLASLLGLTSACGSTAGTNGNAAAGTAAVPASPAASSAASAIALPSASPSAASSPSASPDGNPYETAGVNDPAAFEKMFASLQAAVAANDKADAANYVLYPLRVNGGQEPLIVQDKNDFVDKYDQIFTDDIKRTLATQKPREMFVNAKGIMAGDGEIWFGASADSDQKYGMIAVNLNVGG